MSKYSLNRKISVLVCTIATAIIGIDFSIISKPAHAVAVDLSCAGGYEATYNPPLTLSEKVTTIQSDGTLTCNPILGTDKTIISGSDKGTATITASCDLASQTPTDRTYHWSNGQYSKVHLIPIVNEKPAGDSVVAYEGTVTEGEFINDTVTETLTLATLDTSKCLSNGVPNASGAETITFIKP
ncbi:MAG: hypothetical protein PUP93_21565 [Rhizonema sp. NSF051]|nr:hypothetical protein [Rhizonema sp. NSF051]